MGIATLKYEYMMWERATVGESVKGEVDFPKELMHTK